jgi:N6-L-threonylcarbamoyladenine synthase
VADLAAAFQQSATAVVIDRTAHAMDRFLAEENPARPTLVVAGGVAANTMIRSALGDLASSNGFTLITPPLALCTDNAAMVAWAGIERLSAGLSDPLDFAARPRWPLDAERATISAGAKGAKA